MTYDSRPETFKHLLRVGTLMLDILSDGLRRSLEHDLSKTQDPELSIFNEYTPRLKDLTYGSDEYKQTLEAMGPALQHHYASNRHHPEHFGQLGISGMTLVDLIEMLADWKAATERHADGSLKNSLKIQKTRFNISDQMYSVLINTAVYYDFLSLEDAYELRSMENESTAATTA